MRFGARCEKHEACNQNVRKMSSSPPPSSTPVGANEDIVAFCQQRERFLALQRATADERSENADAIRTIGGLLTESMVRNGIRCLRVMQTNDTPNYIRVIPEQRRAKRIRNIDDVMELLENISADVTDVPFEQLPDALARVITERARQRGDTVPPRVQVTKRVGIREEVTELGNVNKEVETLSKQMQSSVTERNELRERIKPVRAEMIKCEKKITETAGAVIPPSVTETATNTEGAPPPTPAADPPPPVLVQMRMRDATGPAKVLQVSRQTYVKKRNLFGLRQVCNYVRHAMEHISVRDERFDERLRDQVRQIISEEQSKPPEHGQKISVRRGKRARETN